MGKYKKRLALVIVIISMILTSFLAERENVVHHLVIAETSDVHAALFPYDFIREKNVDQGYIAAGYILDSLRNIYGQENVIFIDCGDLLQGDPLAQYYNFMDTVTTHPLIEALNALHCDAFIVGNHDIEQTKSVWMRARKQSQFPWLGANVVSIKNEDSLFFKPYVILKRNGLKVAVLGLTTPAVPNWLPEKIWDGMNFKDMLETAKEYSWLRDSVNILIGAFHSGINPQKGTPGYPEQLPEENASRIIQEKLPIFDVVLTGHEHKLIPRKDTVLLPNQIPIVMPRKKAMYVSVVDIEYQLENNIPKIIRKTVKNIKVHQNKLSAPLLKKFAPIQDNIRKFVNTPIGRLTYPLSGEKSRLEDTPLIELIHTIQKKVTGATISIAASFNPKVYIPAGEVSRKSVFAIYPYENTLYKVQLKGRDLVDLLKRSALYYYVENGQLKVNREIPGYNFDMVDGIKYELIYAENKSPEVKIISMEDGSSFVPDKDYVVAVNSYRAQQLKQIYGAKIIWRSEKSMRDYIEEYFMKNSPVSVEVNNNWKIIFEK